MKYYKIKLTADIVISGVSANTPSEAKKKTLETLEKAKNKLQLISFSVTKINAIEEKNQ